MQYLNIIYFLIITFFGYYFLTSDGKVVKGALNPAQLFHYSGVELFWCLTFATGVLAFSLNVGLDLMAVRLLVLEIFCVLGIAWAKNKAVFSLPLKAYVIFLAWMVLGLFYAPSFNYGIRTILKYVYPFVLCLFASAAVRDREVFFKSSILARWVGVVAAVLSFIPFSYVVFPGVFWYITARVISFIPLMVFSMGCFYFTNKKKENIWFTLFFLAPCFLIVLRTSILGSGIAIMAFFLIKYRIKSLPIIAAVLIVGVVSVFTIPSLRSKMFYDDRVTLQDYREGKIKEENYNTNYRAFMWKKLQGKFYEGHELAGCGTGCAQHEMYTNSKEYGGLKICHSDFVQQKCDNGLIGLGLYGAMMLLIFVDCFRTYWRNEDSAIRLCAIVAGASLLGVYATFYSDNAVNYSMATLSLPFGFYGMMLGMRAQQEEDG